jgi:carotenoid cleavage dioxygenase-like enzyme
MTNSLYGYGIFVILSFTALFPITVFFGISDFINSFDDQTHYNANDNQYLKGNFAPVSTENFNVKLDALHIPNDLAGVYLRVGPNPLSGPSHFSRGHMLFDGDGMIHSVRVSDGDAYYSNQWIGTPSHTQSRRHDRPVAIKIGEIRGYLGLFKVIVLGPMINMLFGLSQLTASVANTQIFLYNDKIYAGHEASLPFEIQWNPNNTFSSVGFEGLEGGLDYPFNAHPKLDPVTNTLYFGGYDFNSQSGMKVGSWTPAGKLDIYHELKLPVKTWAHDTVISQNFFIIVEGSVGFTDVERVMKGVFFDFMPQHKFRVGLVPKTAQTSEEAANRTVWFEANEPLAFVHVMNAWEEKEDEVVVWGPLSDHFDGSLQVANHFYLAEIRMNLRTGKMMIDKRSQDDTIVEFPRVHPRCVSLPSRYGFAVKFTQGKGVLDIYGIVKYDLFSKKKVGDITFPKGVYGGEAAPIPKGKSRDMRRPHADCASSLSGAVYMTMFVFDTNTNTSEWHVYDGESMSNKPTVRVPMPKGIRVPYGFHGEWISEQQLNSHFHRHNKTTA